MYYCGRKQETKTGRLNWNRGYYDAACLIAIGILTTDGRAELAFRDNTSLLESYPLEEKRLVYISCCLDILQALYFSL